MSWKEGGPLYVQSHPLVSQFFGWCIYNLKKEKETHASLKQLFNAAFAKFEK